MSQWPLTLGLSERTSCQHSRYWIKCTAPPAIMSIVNTVLITRYSETGSFMEFTNQHLTVRLITEQKWVNVTTITFHMSMDSLSVHLHSNLQFTLMLILCISLVSPRLAILLHKTLPHSSVIYHAFQQYATVHLFKGLQERNGKWQYCKI